MTEVIRRQDVSDHITHVVLDRPDKLNALDADARVALAETIRACGQDDQVRVIVVRGEGRAFSTGADAADPGDGDSASPVTAWADRGAMRERGWGLFLAAWDAPVPVIAQVHGFCLGIASVLCNLCDIVVVADDARIGWPRLPLGGGVISPTWVWHVGIHKAKELSYQTGAEVSGTEAARLGFANQAVPADQLAAHVDALARRIARMPRDLLQLKKEALNQVLEAMGFRQAVLQGAAWGALSHDMAATAQVRGLIQEIGLRGAIDRYRGPDG